MTSRIANWLGLSAAWWALWLVVGASGLAAPLPAGYIFLGALGSWAWATGRIFWRW